MSSPREPSDDEMNDLDPALLQMLQPPAGVEEVDLVQGIDAQLQAQKTQRHLLIRYIPMALAIAAFATYVGFQSIPGCQAPAKAEQHQTP